MTGQATYMECCSDLLEKLLRPLVRHSGGLKDREIKVAKVGVVMVCQHRFSRRLCKLKSEMMVRGGGHRWMMNLFSQFLNRVHPGI